MIEQINHILGVQIEKKVEIQTILENVMFVEGVRDLLQLVEPFGENLICVSHKASRRIHTQ